MMKSKPFLVTLLATFFAAACYPVDSEQKAVDARVAEATFLTAETLPEVEVFRSYQQVPALSVAAQQKAMDFIVDGEEDIYVRLQNSAGKTVDSWVADSPDYEIPVLADAFYSRICEQDTLVLVLEKGVSTGVSTGKVYINALFEPASGEWLTTFLGAEVTDRKSGELFVNNQKALLQKLKAGANTNCPELLDPAAMSQALNWLLEEH
ncbi:hypothetical protein [Alkalimonas mucilaginosa]|uniref:Lipoprotein n=1 Tax=Alkalimonas mucilaginosa TaxID=3057676 RepID=A0ABU7JBF9_9GAMM|nr:hypothetical protein [Alkalimonas sp. MEB004]MEE2022995.1 hypothetical protein [Alkalimonas sp. MEB004]